MHFSSFVLSFQSPNLHQVMLAESCHFSKRAGGAFVIIGHLSIGATAVLFDPNCFDLDEIRADVLICICHAPNVMS